MKPVRILIVIFMTGLCISFAQAQTADEVIKKYFEISGGKAKWEGIQGLSMTAKMSLQGMELPLTMIQLKDGRQGTKATFQGMTFYEGMYDGTTLWGSNPMTQAIEKSDAETTENFKATVGLDFPDPFFNYAAKGYKVELLGKEAVDGAEALKIKLTKKPVKLGGVETEDAVVYYFNATTFLPVMTETEIKSGPAKGYIKQNKMSNYQEVGGIKFAYTMKQGIKGQPGESTITISAIEMNPTVDPTFFTMPGGK